MQIPVDVAGRALRRAAQQLVRVGQHDRVPVDVHDAGVRRFPLRHLVHVVFLGDAGADVEELPDPGVPGEVPHDPAERPPGAGARRPAPRPARPERPRRRARRPPGRPRSWPGRRAGSHRRAPHAPAEVSISAGSALPAGIPLLVTAFFLRHARTVRDQQTSSFSFRPRESRNSPRCPQLTAGASRARRPPPGPTPVVAGSRQGVSAGQRVSAGQTSIRVRQHVPRE